MSTVIPTSQEPVTLPNEILEISISIAVKELDPSLVNEQFLKFSGIVPNEWELNQQPVVSKAGSQLVFKNGLSIVAQPRSLTFLEGMNDKTAEVVTVGKVASAFVEKLPNAQYNGVVVTPKCLIPLPDQNDGARKFITGTLLASGAWQDLGKAPVQAAVEFTYLLEGCQFNLKVNQATLQIPDRQAVSALLFAGNFNYSLNNPNPQERVNVAKQYIEAWQSDLDTFRGIVHEKFLAEQQPQTVFG
jgi:hypothetical protein